MPNSTARSCQSLSDVAARRARGRPSRTASLSNIFVPPDNRSDVSDAPSPPQIRTFPRRRLAGIKRAASYSIPTMNGNVATPGGEFYPGYTPDSYARRHQAALALGTPYESPRTNATGGEGDYFSQGLRRQDPLGDLDELRKSLEPRSTMLLAQGRQLEHAWTPVALGKEVRDDEKWSMMEVDDDGAGKCVCGDGGGNGLELESPFAERFPA
jgi:hypothetical protein